MTNQRKCRGNNCLHYELGELAGDLAKGETVLPCGIAEVVKLFAKALEAFEHDIAQIEECQNCPSAQRVEEYRELLATARAKVKHRSLLSRPSRRKNSKGQGKNKQSA